MGFTEFRGASVTSLVCLAFLWHMSILGCVPTGTQKLSSPKSYRGSPDVSCRVSQKGTWEVFESVESTQS